MYNIQCTQGESKKNCRVVKSKTVDRILKFKTNLPTAD